MGQKIAFGLGMLANQMFPAALGIFMVILVQGLGMSPILWGLIFFLPKLVDAITDPLMGYISDRTESRWGKRRPYIFIGAIVAGISYMAMWQLSAENSQMYNFWYFLGWSVVFFIGMTIFSVPYVAMGYEMSKDYHERTRLMAVAQWIGQWAWVIAPGLGHSLRPRLVFLLCRGRPHRFDIRGTGLYGTGHGARHLLPICG